MTKAIDKIKYRIKKIVKHVFRISPEIVFVPAKSICKQTMEFMFKDRLLAIEADYTTPLYDTIAEIVDYDCYQLQHLPLHKGNDVAIVDIGANIGISSVVLSTLIDGKVYCCEPMEVNCRYLERNKKLNGAANIEILQKAVTSTTGTETFHVEEQISVSAHAASTGLEKRSATKIIQVDSISLGDLLNVIGNKKIALMKIDCEGGEYGILEQLDRTLSERIMAMTFEIHDLDEKRNVHWVEQKLRELGYSILKKKEMFNRSTLHHILALREP